MLAGESARASKMPSSPADGSPQELSCPEKRGRPILDVLVLDNQERNEKEPPRNHRPRHSRPGSTQATKSARLPPAGPHPSPLCCTLTVPRARRWLVIWSGTRCLVLALAASGVLPGVVDRGDPVGAEPGVVLDGVEADLVAVRVVQMGQNPADAGPVHPGVPPAQRHQPGRVLVDRLRALPSVSTRARIASWLRSRTWCFTPTAGRQCSSVRTAAWSAGA